MARLTDQLLTALDVDQIDVLGFSWGGALAQQFALDFGTRCHRIVLMATTAGGSMSLPDPAQVMSVLSDTGAFSGKESDGSMYQLGATAGWSSMGWLNKLEHATLVLSASDDTLVPGDHARMLADLIPNAQLDIVQGEHMVLLRQPEKAVGVIEQFLSAPG